MNITFQQGDISVVAPIDAVVNPASTDLRIIAGIGGVLRRAGGPAVEDDVRAQAPIALGGVAVGSGGNLRARYVIHAAVVSYQADDLMGPREDGALIHGTTLRHAMREILAAAAKLELRSLAMPDLTEPSVFPTDLGARIILSELYALITEGGPTTLETVVFVFPIEDQRETYQAAWETLRDLRVSQSPREETPTRREANPLDAPCVAFKPA